MEIILKYFSNFTPAQLQQFAALENLYKEWNEKINIISRKDIHNFYLHHVLHSLSIAAVADFKTGSEVIDIGCGGGFPGIPLAIFFPEVKFYLVDSIAKKLKVVDDVCEILNIKNIITHHTRVEEIKNKKFDFAVSRAVAPLKDLWQWANPLLNKTEVRKQKLEDRRQETGIANSLICLKGGNLHSEIAQSHTRPKMMSIYDIFQEEYFKEKFIVQVKK